MVYVGCWEASIGRSTSFSATRSPLQRAWQRRRLSTRAERRNCGALTAVDGDGPGLGADVIYA